MDSILDVIYEAIARENALRAVPISLQAGPQTVLYGFGSALDSMSLVSIIIDIEEAIAAKFGINVALVSDAAMSARASPFATVQSLADHVSALAARKLQ